MSVKRHKAYPGFWLCVRQATRVRLADKRSYAWSLVLEMLMLLLILSVYQFSFQATDGVLALSLPQTIWTLVFAKFIAALNEQSLAWRMSGDIYSGAIATWINRPLSYIGMVFSRYLGQTLISLVPHVFFMPCLGYWFVGLPALPDQSLSVFLAMIVLVVTGFCTRLSLYFCLGLASFWTENSGPVISLVRKLFMLFNGSMVPLQLLPAGWRAAAEILPFGASAAATQFYAPDFLARTSWFLVLQLGWTLLFSFIAALLWRQAQRRMFVNGG